MAILILPSQSLVLNAYAVLIGSTPGNASFKDHQAYIATSGVTAYKAALEGYASSVMTNAQLATALLTNLGLGTSFTQAQAEAFLTANTGNRVGAMTDLAAALYGYNGTDAKLLASKAAYVTAIEGSFNFSNNIANVNGQALTPVATVGQTYALVVGLDNLVGTAFNDSFTARTLNNANTLNDGDKIDGGAGNDTVYVDFTSLGNAITPVLKNIETVVVRAQTTTTDATNGNNQFGNTVQIDAQRSLAVDVADKVTADVGVTRWESNNSRSDVIIEDVRIGNAQKTKDITIAMVETDPGNVDYGVYFDQFSLRNASSGTSSLNIQIMDTGAAATAATAATPLLNNPYDTFRIGINGVLAEIKLNTTAAPTTAASADTYAQLLAAIQAALLAAGGSATASLGADFTVTDPLSNTAVTGKTIVLTGGAGFVFSAIAGSGWFNTTGAAVPASSNIYTTFATGSTQVSELVTSTVLLDDVGRGSTGGDLVIGGMSVGQTSTSRGVERFEITVNDNSKLQTINSTNNALREVTIVSGTTSDTVVDAYTTTVTNEGDLTVNGNVNASTDANLAGVNNYSRSAALGGTVGGVAVVNHAGSGATGFTDVRLIDASAFKGKLAFTATVSSDSIPKYVTAVDTSANPAADVAGTGNVNFNVPGANFIYTGGNDNDTMAVTIDAGVASSRSTILSGLSDFTFNFSGGEGNDAITTTINSTTLAGGAQAWYTNQKLNANITINGGAGNDTIRTPGAGDKIINGDAGIDTIYTDNTGALAASAQATGSATAAAIAYTNAAAAELAMAQAANVASNTTGFVPVAGSNTGATVTTAAAAAALNTLNLVTPVDFASVPVHSALVTAINTATTAGGLTFAQNIALNAAYGNTATAGTVVPATTLVAQAITGFVATADATVVTQAQFDAGNALLDSYIVAANAAAATATANDTFFNSAAPAGPAFTILNATQAAVVAATHAVNRVADLGAAVPAGTQTTVNNLAILSPVFAVGATDATIVTALQAAVANGSITGGQATALFGAAVASAGTVDATELANTVAILTPIQTTAATANTTAQATLTAALAADVTAVNTAAAIAAADPTNGVGDAIAGNNVGSTEAATAVTTATAALTAANAVAVTGLTAATNKATNLAALKAAITLGTTDLAVVTATANAVANGSILAADQTAINAAATAVTGTVGVPVTAAEKLAVDVLITALQVTNDILLADATIDAANLTAVIAATTLASTVATAAANSGAATLTIASPKAVYVFDTSGQNVPYNRATMDERNLADLKSDVNNTYNFFNSTVKVTYKGIDASVIVAGTGYKTSDLEINQAIKQAINSDPILSKLLVATDGPANSLVVTSLIDGTHALTNLAVTVTMPTAVTAADLAGAITAGLVAAGSTDAQLITAMGATKAAFDTKGDYVTQWAEAGAAGTAANANLVGANSTSSSDNTVTPGTENDVIVLGTTVGTDLLTSSNEVVVYTGSFGNDTIVYFAAAGLGIDQLNFSALNGRGSAFGSLSADKSVVVGAPVATALTAVQIAALFTDSATAINHVYVAVDTNNIGSIWQVADAAGVAAGNVAATLVGSIDLADTSWASLTAANFV